MNIKNINGIIGNKLISTLGFCIKTLSIKNTTDFYIHVDAFNLKKVLNILALSTTYKLKTLNEIVAIDFPYDLEYRFRCIYILSSWKYANRLLISVSYKENSIIYSITDIFTCAEWYEREIWDLYGLWFENHPNLRRILNDYGYRDYPFRKDYPLNGYIQIQYNSILNSVIIHKLTSLQEFRVWDFQSPWVSENSIQPITKYKEFFDLTILETINDEELVVEEIDKEAIIEYVKTIQDTENIYEEEEWELTTFTNE